MAHEKRLIDANSLVLENSVLMEDEYGLPFKCVLEEDIRYAPTIEAVEIIHGRWEQVQRWATKAKYRCSICGREIMSAVKVNIEKYPYCHCGAKMDGGNEDG